MIMRTDESVPSRIAALQKELADLQQQVAEDQRMVVRPLPSRGRPPKEKVAAPAVSVPTPARKSKKRRRRTRNRLARLEIAPGIALTAIPGTLYATLCRVLAQLGHLAKHDDLFKTFEKEATTAASHALLQQIGVARGDLERLLYADEQFLAHCKKRTDRYRAAAAAGNKQYQKLLKDLNICDAEGNWRGNLTEAIATLYGARTLTQVRKGKNLQILNKAGLMFDSVMIGSEQFCFLYAQNWHSTFKKALSLARA